MSITCSPFGFATALQFQGVAVGLDIAVASQLIRQYRQALFNLAGLAGASRQPRALTLPFRRGP